MSRDVLAVVAVLGPAGVARLDAWRAPAPSSARFCDLRAGVVVVELARDLRGPALRAARRSRRRAPPGGRGRRAAGRSGWRRRTRPGPSPRCRALPRPKRAPCVEDLPRRPPAWRAASARKLMKPAPGDLQRFAQAGAGERRRSRRADCSAISRGLPPAPWRAAARRCMAIVAVLRLARALEHDLQPAGVRRDLRCTPSRSSVRAVLSDRCHRRGREL